MQLFPVWKASCRSKVEPESLWCRSELAVLTGCLREEAPSYRSGSESGRKLLFQSAGTVNVKCGESVKEQRCIDFIGKLGKILYIVVCICMVDTVA